MIAASSEIFIWRSVVAAQIGIIGVFYQYRFTH
jgi:hypothetical protein